MCSHDRPAPQHGVSRAAPQNPEKMSGETEFRHKKFFF